MEADAGSDAEPDVPAEQICSPGAPACEQDLATHCNAAGTGYVAGGRRCTAEETCLAGVCEAHECEPGARFCSGNTVRDCKLYGLSSTELFSCAAGQYCDAASVACHDGVCAPNAASCDGNRATSCNAAGSGYQAGGTVCKASETCEAGKCVAQLCEPGTQFCQGQDVKVCAANGLSSTIVSSCSNQTCVASGASASCKGSCAPGQTSCANNGVQACDANGQFGGQLTSCGDKTCVATGAAARCAECNATTPFGSPRVVAGLSAGTEDWNTQLTPDELGVYFTSHRGSTTWDVYTATRSSRSAAFGTAQPIGSVNTPTTEEYWATVTGDGLTMYVEKDLALFVAVRPSTSAPWSALSASGLEPGGTPHVSSDGNTLYYHRTVNGDDDLYVSRRQAATWQAPTPLTELNSPSREYSPVVSRDGLVVYFGSERTAGGTKGGQDIWTARRTSASAPFENLQTVAEVNTVEKDQPSWLSTDKCRLYFSRYDPQAGMLLSMVAERSP